MLAGCSGSQPPIPMPQDSAIATRADRGKSGSGDLLYVAAAGTSYFFSYPKIKLVGTLKNAGAADVCSDKSGNVFLTQGGNVLEYAHGATSPEATLEVPGDSRGCAVDPGSDDLAVVYSKTSGNDVAIFHNESGSPTLYSSTLFVAFYCPRCCKARIANTARSRERRAEGQRRGGRLLRGQRKNGSVAIRAAG